MSKNTKYDDLCKQITSAVKANGTSSYSHGDFVSLSHALLNSPDYEEDIYLRDATKGEPEKVTQTPSKDYRESLKDVVGSFGVDKKELGKLDTMQFNRKHAEAICGLATTLLNGYTSTGRRFKLPMTSKNQSQMSIQKVDVKEKKTASRRIEKDPKTGEYTSRETDDIITTKAHTAMSASNATPAWLKSTAKKK
jgi:hypothetical protein